MFTYRYINNNKPNLLCYFNNMTKVGYDSNFSLYNTLPTLFPDHDILYIKDIAYGQFYLTIITHIKQFIQERASRYTYVIGIADSSGTIPLLNILPSLDNFYKAVIINGQFSLNPNIVKEYAHATDVYIFDPNKVSSNYDKSYLEPLNNISADSHFKLLFHYNKSVSDAIYAKHLPSMKCIDVILHDDSQSHANFIISNLKNTSFLNGIKEYLLS